MQVALPTVTPYLVSNTSDLFGQVWMSRLFKFQTWFVCGIRIYQVELKCCCSYFLQDVGLPGMGMKISSMLVSDARLLTCIPPTISTEQTFLYSGSQLVNFYESSPHRTVIYNQNFISIFFSVGKPPPSVQWIFFIDHLQTMTTDLWGNWPVWFAKVMVLLVDSIKTQTKINFFFIKKGNRCSKQGFNLHGKWI